MLLVSVTSGAQTQIDTLLNENFSDFNFPSNLNNRVNTSIDSVLLESYFYDKLKQKETGLPVAGNLGSASFNPFQKNVFDKLWYDGFNQFAPYEIYPLSPFPSTYPERRFTNINYHIASKKEQHIFLKHEQKIKPYLVAGLDFGALSSPGDFSRTLKTSRNFDIYFGYESRSKVYRNYVSYTSNRILNQENGGIKNDFEFEEATSLDTRTLPINLTNASVKLRSRDFMVRQELNLSRIFDKADSLERKQKFKSGSLVLTHSLWLKNKFSLFTSLPDRNYFDNVYNDTVITFDSTMYKDLYQIAMIEYTTPVSENGKYFSAGLGYEFQDVDYYSGGVDTSFSTRGTDTTLATGAGILTAAFTSPKFYTKLFFAKNITGDLNDGYRARLSLSYDFGKNSNNFYLDISAGKISHALKDLVYFSNHFIWKNEFDPLEQYEASGGLLIARYKVRLEIRNSISKNRVFYHEDFLPQSYGSYVSVSEASLAKSFQIGKVGMDGKVIGRFSGNEQVVPVSPLVVFGSLFYRNQFFKNVLGFKAGVDVTWYAEYYGYGYMPATGIFYVQDEKKTGNYPVAGAFINMKIKSKATLFIRLDHFNAGIGERIYYGSYQYPLNGRTFKFGVNWDLVD